MLWVVVVVTGDNADDYRDDDTLADNHQLCPSLTFWLE